MQNREYLCTARTDVPVLEQTFPESNRRSPRKILADGARSGNIWPENCVVLGTAVPKYGAPTGRPANPKGSAL